MNRLFQTHIVRKSTTLDGVWDFALSDRAEPFSSVESYRYRLPVPGCWETHPELNTYRGIGIYRRNVEVERETSLRFEFKGVSHTGHVYFDGEKIAEHYNAYTAFEAVVRNVRPGSHELVVVVDNSFGEASSLHVPNDYYTYGGIIRPVTVEEIGNCYIERIAFTPGLEQGKWKGDIQAVVTHAGDEPCRLRVTAKISEQELNLGFLELEPGETRAVEGSFAFPEAEAWSLAYPKLYSLNVKLYLDSCEDPCDDLIERVGFRTVTTYGGKIQLNGEDIVLKGFNRHEDHPAVGSALPISLMAHDLELMIDMGSNAVRTSHYPNDERFLDLCDERGILVWEENHARGLSLEQMRNPNFVWQCEQVNREMVEQHRNHPSIVIWGILNECASDTDEGKVHYERQFNQIRVLDASRPLTFASCHREKELCFDLADIVSVNLYPGWYGDEDPGELCDAARGWADAAGGAGKPMIMSEFGGDGHYGLRDSSRVRGTEERQADILESNLMAYSARPYLSGMLIWQFCDCRVTEGTGWLLSRAGTQNSKGVVDRYRRPKLAYSIVQRYFKESRHITK